MALPPSSVPGAYIIFNKRLIDASKQHTCCAEGLVDIRDWLIGMLDDEPTASVDYAGVSKVLNEHDLADLGNKFHHQSEDEFQHYLNAVATISILNEICQCPITGKTSAKDSLLRVAEGAKSSEVKKMLRDFAEVVGRQENL